MLLPEVAAGHLRFLILNAVKRTHRVSISNAEINERRGSQSATPALATLELSASAGKKLKAEGC